MLRSVDPAWHYRVRCRIRPQIGQFNQNLVIWGLTRIIARLAESIAQRDARLAENMADRDVETAKRDTRLVLVIVGTIVAAASLATAVLGIIITAA